MTFAEIIPALLEGKRARRSIWDDWERICLREYNCETYLAEKPDWRPHRLSRESLTATDWEIVDD